MTSEGPLAACLGASTNDTFPTCRSGNEWRLRIEAGNHIFLADMPPQQDRERLSRRLIAAMSSGDHETLATLDGRFAAILVGPDDIILARDPLGARPLHFRLERGTLHVGTMPQDLEQPDDEADYRWLARRATMQPRLSTLSANKAIQRVPPGAIARWHRGAHNVSISRYWKPDRTPLSLDFEAVVDEGKTLFGAAVERALAGTNTLVATQLTGGLDSPLVAIHARDKATLLALTGTHSFAPVDPGGDYFLDEADRAARIARHLGIEHAVVSASQASLLDLLDQWQTVLCEPVANADNLSWLDPLYETARDAGARRVLTGGLGNFTLSWPGSGALSEMARRGMLARWLKAARAHHHRLGASWRGIIALTLPWLRPRAPEQTRFIEGPDGVWDPPADRRELRADILLGHDPGPWNEAVRRRYGIDEVDVFADRALVEFSMRLRETHCYQPGQPRALIRAMLRGHIPDAVIDERKRGLQGADWPQRLEMARADMLAALATMPAPAPFKAAQMAQALCAFDPSNANTDEETETRFDLVRAFAALRLAHRIGA